MIEVIAKFWKVVRDKIYSLEFTPYLIPFEKLVERCVNRMVIKVPDCPFCHKTMYFRSSHIVVLNGPVRDDQNYKCSSCFYLVSFGIPMTRKDALEERRLRGGHLLCRPTHRRDERDLEVIIKRLTKLGYLE